MDDVKIVITQRRGRPRRHEVQTRGADGVWITRMSTPDRGEAHRLAALFQGKTPRLRPSDTDTGSADTSIVH